MDFLDKLEEKIEDDEEEIDAHDVTDALGEDEKYWKARNQAQDAKDASKKDED